MKIENTVHIEAPVGRVWHLTVDVDSWPKHVPTMTEVRRLNPSPLTIGSRVRIKQRGQRSRVWTVSAMESERRFAWTTAVLGTSMTAAHSLVPTVTGTTQTLAVHIEGRLSRLVVALLGRPIGRAIALENEGFKSAAENEHGGDRQVAAAPHCSHSIISQVIQ